MQQMKIMDNMEPYSLSQDTIVLKPKVAQWLISYWAYLVCAVLAFGISTIDGFPFPKAAVLTSIFFALCAFWYLGYMRSLTYRISPEQLQVSFGVMTTEVEYMELFRINDYKESSTMLQKLFGIKNVIITSNESKTPELTLIGVPRNLDIISVIRQRVITNRKKYNIHEIANR